MTEQDYKKLNENLNMCFLELEKTDSIFIKYLYEISFSSDSIIKACEGNIINRVKSNHLSYADVFYLGREIIEIINPKYLDKYDDLIKSGILDFGYHNEYTCSSYVYMEANNQNIINIRRNFSYDDVCSLVHEFMHYTNGQTIRNSISTFLTEFISIYFEEYTKRYLIETKQINSEEINSNDRIIDFLRTNRKFNSYCLVLVAFEKLGEITPSTPEEMRNILEIGDKSFEQECKSLLDMLEHEKKNALSDENVAEKMTEKLKYSYRYIVGTLLAFYALEHCKMEDIAKLNDNINSEKYENMSLVDVLKTIGIEINTEMLEEAIECVKKNIQNDKVMK